MLIDFTPTCSLPACSIGTRSGPVHEDPDALTVGHFSLGTNKHRKPAASDAEAAIPAGGDQASAEPP